MIRDNDKIRSDAIVLACTLINHDKIFKAYGYGHYGSDQEKVKKLIDEAVYLVERKDKLMLEKLNSVVNCGDLVVLSIDGAEPRRYLINRFNQEYNTIDVVCGAPEIFFENLDAHSDLAKSIIGQEVGKEISCNNDDKMEHTVKIISTRKTELSEKISEDELKADLQYIKRK